MNRWKLGFALGVCAVLGVSCDFGYKEKPHPPYVGEAELLTLQF